MRSFSEKIRYDIKTFFDESLKLIQEQNQNLVNYYTSEGFFPKEAFDLLDSLKVKAQMIYNKLSLNRQNFDNYSDFLVFDQIEDFISFFNVVDNYSRWLKSSTVKGRYQTLSEIEYVLKQNQTLESFSSELGYLDRETGFLDLSLRNQIKETDYDLNGGLVFKFTYQGEQTLQLQTVVDEMTGENLLGKDISKKMQFVQNDMLYLTPKETFVQTCEILTGLLKNSNPEFPNDGFDKASISNKNILNSRLSTFIRQMYSTVGKDDTISSFTVSDVQMEGDSLKIEVQYESYLSDNVRESVYGN